MSRYPTAMTMLLLLLACPVAAQTADNTNADGKLTAAPAIPKSSDLLGATPPSESAPARAFTPPPGFAPAPSFTQSRSFAPSPSFAPSASATQSRSFAPSPSLAPSSSNGNAGGYSSTGR